MSGNLRHPCDEAVVRSATDVKDCGTAIGRWVLLAAILGSSITFIDGTVVNVALPVLQSELGASVSGAQWIVESYALMLASLILVGGSLGDRLGRRRIFMAGVALFGLASVWCGLAPGLANLVAARTVQGIGAALLVPGSLALISANFPKKRRGRAIGTWSGFTAIAAGIGPVIGGWLVANLSWRWIFFINIPLVAAVLLISWLRVIGLASLTGFVFVEARTKHPMMPFELFRSRTFAGANLLTLFLYAALGGLLFFLPFNLIQVQGYTPAVAGAALLPFVITMFVLSRWAGGLVDHYGSKMPLIIGPLIAGAGFAMFAIPGAEAGSFWTSFFPAIMIMSAGMSIAVAPLTTTVMGAVEERHAGIASGINNAVSRTASLIAVAVFGVVMLGVFGSDLNKRLSSIQITAEAKSQILTETTDLVNLKIPENIKPDDQTAIRKTVVDSFVSGFRWVTFLAAGLAVVSAIASWWLIEGKIKEK